MFYLEIERRLQARRNAGTLSDFHGEHMLKVGCQVFAVWSPEVFLSFHTPVSVNHSPGYCPIPGVIDGPGLSHMVNDR